jgi:hypothetical protein
VTPFSASQCLLVIEEDNKPEEQLAGWQDLVYSARHYSCQEYITATAAIAYTNQAADSKHLEQLADRQDLAIKHNPTIAQSTSGRHAVMALCDRASP